MLKRFLSLSILFFLSEPALANGYYNLTAFWKGTAQTNQWKVMNWPDPKGDHTAVWTGSKMIVYGGSSGQPSNTGFIYDPTADSWTQITRTNAPDHRWKHTAVWTGTKMIVWGGFNGGNNGNVLNTGGSYDPSTDTWTATSVGANVPSGRGYHTAVWTGTYMIIWGGSANYNESTPVNTGGRYDPSTDTWAVTSTTSAPAARTGHTAIWDSNNLRMVIWGGWNASGTYYNNGYSYNPASTGTWTALAASTLTARKGHTAVFNSTNSTMLIWGGINGTTYYNDGAKYDGINNTWSASNGGAITTTGAPTARTQHTAVWTGSAMIIWGGWNGTTYYNDGKKYDPTANSWSTGNGGTVTSTSAPQVRRQHTAVWTGSKMIVWGGFDGTYMLDTGGQYDPTANTWTSTLANTAPGARYGATGVWTGSKVIVWGGSADFTGGTIRFNTGGLYDPATDSWTPTSTGANVAQTRESHCAVWTGTKMIVWGGWTFDGTMDGGQYDPGTDTWTAVTSTGSPAGAINPGCVWSSAASRMWTYGGKDVANTPFSGGGVYNPATNTWSVLPTTGSPPGARENHQVVMAGNNMIVWGGTSDGSTPLNTGSYFNGTTWTAITTTGAAAARASYAAAWSGTYFIVWGGTPGSGQLNTGGRYNMTSWSTMTTTGAPYQAAHGIGEAFPWAVWSGKYFLVWGGTSDTVPEYTLYSIYGGAYDPSTDTWTAMPTKNAPMEREGHTAVWAGSYLFIYGGVNTNDWTFFNPIRSYGLYTPP